jgi:myosin protein heavy chain
MASKSDYEQYLVWRRPDNFQFRITADKKYLWIPKSEEKDKRQRTYVLAEVLDDSDDTVVVCRVCDTGTERILDKNDTDGVNPPKFDGVKDCAQLGYLSPPSVLYNLKIRYDSSVIYTYSGLFCVAVNPYRFFPIYHEGIIKLYVGRRRDELEPHVYAVADEAYRCLLNDRKPQSMLVTGESGAGKTENTKKIIQYLAAIAGKSGAEGALEKQLLQANPLLEALGNAKTTKNNNSSRFGKFIKITFGSNSFISGASIVSYLLERSRVVHQGPNERCFHIFYQLMEGLPPEKKQSYYLTDPDDYAYLNHSGCTRVVGMEDSKEFAGTLNALKVLSFNPEEIDTIFRVVAGVCHMGNLKFEGDEVAKISNIDSLKKVAELWQVDAKALEDSLIRPRIQVGAKQELIAKELNPQKAASSREAVCKAIYGRMFLWIVDKINETLKVQPKDLFIGILDIAGFEIFDFNSFEQLCINFTNERLQQFFNNHMFHLEQEEYKREKIEWQMINFNMDSQATIDLIAKSGKGIVALLDEECVVPNGSDKSFTQKLRQTHGGKHPKFNFDRLGGDLSFNIEHYAGSVTYDTSEWLDKNKDPLEADLELCISNSKNPFVSRFFVEFALNLAAQSEQAKARQLSTRKKAGIFNTVGGQYKEQLASLLETLESTNPHFIRCIIPNHKQKPGEIEDSIVLNQLACNGIPQALLLLESTAPARKAATKTIVNNLIKKGVIEERFNWCSSASEKCRR